MKLSRRTMGRRAIGHAALAAVATGVASRRAAASESAELRISSLEGFGFLPLSIALDRRLIETHAATLGLEDLHINHLPLRSAVISTDALLAGQLDVIAGTITSLLVLWDKTNGDVRVVSDLGGQVLTLVTRNPNVHSIVDFGPGDRAEDMHAVDGSQALVQLGRQGGLVPADGVPPEAAQLVQRGAEGHCADHVGRCARKSGRCHCW